MRFTIRQMMAWTVGIGVVLGVLFGFPDIVALPLLALFVMSLPVVLIVGTIYGTSWKRTFFIGALIATSPMLLMVMVYGPMMLFGVSFAGELDFSELAEVSVMTKVYTVGFVVFAALNGAIALGVRWLVSEPVPTPMPQQMPAAGAPLVNRLETVPLPYVVMEGRVTVEST